MPFPSRYPWSKWFSQKRFTIVHGKDFTCKVGSMSMQLRQKCYELQKTHPKVMLSIEERSPTTLICTVTNPIPRKKAKVKR